MHDAGNQKGLRSGRIVVLSGILSDPLKLPPNFYKTRQTKPQVNVPVQNCMLQAIFLVPCVPCVKKNSECSLLQDGCGMMNVAG